MLWLARASWLPSWRLTICERHGLLARGDSSLEQRPGHVGIMQSTVMTQKLEGSQMKTREISSQEVECNFFLSLAFVCFCCLRIHHGQLTVSMMALESEIAL